jgi:putative membrane protein
MHIGSHYTLKEFLYWTRREIYKLLIIATVPTFLFQFFEWHWLSIPWLPVTLVGTAAAFIVGFKNTQTYNRLWEARQIWGAIVNNSRSWGIMVKDGLLNINATTHRQLIYRHLAWLIALRYQLREPRSWENTDKPYNVEYSRYYKIPERESKLEDELKQFLPDDELNYILGKKNRATQLISLQSKQLKQLKDAGSLETLIFVELENLLVQLYEQQGKCERIKNFPYPRQFASINLFFIKLFVLLLPFGMITEFHKMGELMGWLNIPFTVLIGWIFVSMEKVGEATENPFEGGANDIPMATLCRTIEIDLRDMLEETDLPPALVPMNNILM